MSSPMKSTVEVVPSLHNDQELLAHYLCSTDELVRLSLATMRRTL